MVLRISRPIAVTAAVVLLSGCSYINDSLLPMITGDEAVEESAQSVEIPASNAEKNPAPTLSPPASMTAPATAGAPVAATAPPPALGNSTFVAPGVTSAAATGTFVGQKVVTMRAELGQLQQKLNGHNNLLQQIRTSSTANSQRYHGTMAAINTRLQMGTTPGNPVLVNQWNQAQAELERLGADISAMNSLANNVAGDASMSAYLLESARASYGLSGAIDEDHRQLAILEDETNRTVVLIDRLLNELSEDISRQTAYVGNERSNLTTLSLAIKNGELYGSSLANRAYLSSAPIASAGAVPGTTTRHFAGSSGQPLVVIRFDRPDVPYEQALYTAINRTLQSRPDSSFDVVAVTPLQGGAGNVALNQSKSGRNAERVLRSLTDMGMPASRVSLSSTSSEQASTNEVHIYVR